MYKKDQNKSIVKTKNGEIKIDGRDLSGKYPYQQNGAQGKGKTKRQRKTELSFNIGGNNN